MWNPEDTVRRCCAVLLSGVLAPDATGTILVGGGGRAWGYKGQDKMCEGPDVTARVAYENSNLAILRVSHTCNYKNFKIMSRRARATKRWGNRGNVF